MFETIQGKYTFFIITSVTCFLALLLFVNYTLFKDNSLEQAERTSSLILSSADTQLDLIFEEIEALATVLSRQRTVYEVDVERMSELFINNVLVRSDHIRAIYLGTVFGKMYEWGTGEGFTNYQPEFPLDYDPRERPWYKQALLVDGYVLTSPYIYASVEALGITAVRPVYDGEELIGVIGLDLILHGLDNLVRSLKIPMSGRVILLNSDIEILVDQFSPAVEKKMELEVFAFPELIDSSTPYLISEVFGSRYMISSVSNRATGWTILLFLPYSEIVGFSQQMMKIIIGFNILLMIMLGSLIAFMTRKILTYPLERIIGVLRQFESGVTAARIPDLPGREFSLISRLFNRLSDQSAESSRRMEEKVDQRTKAVIRLQQENVRLRIIEEKERIYGNLHDSLGARLTSINISNHVAKSALARDERMVLQEMHERIENNTRQGILDLKEILSAGEGEGMVRRDFHSFVEKVVKERLALKHIYVEAILPEEAETSLLDPELLADCEKILQELVSNTMKHAGAANVKLEMSLGTRRVHLKYSDDGEGFNRKEAMKNGFGLHGLYSRAERMGGFLKINSKPGRGAIFDFQFRTVE